MPFDYTDQNINIDGTNVPTLLYGTAWKDEKTEALTDEALKSGFRGIDTANQRKHYFEAGVGNAVTAYLENTSQERSALFLQTKYTYSNGQDHRKPYDESSDIKTQIFDSFKSSLIHLNTDVIDSYILHGPLQQEGLCTEDFEAWDAISTLKNENKVSLIGVSNFRPHQLIELYEKSEVKPQVVQNRCFAALGWDRKIREFCMQNEMIYQGFSLLTANRKELGNSKVLEIADTHSKTVAEIILRFSQHIGILPLSGTTSHQHMKEDLSIYSFKLSSDEINAIENITEEITRYD